MNHRQIEIYDFILSLAYRTIGITNQQIASLLERYCYNTILSMAEIKAQIQTDILGISKEITERKEEGNLFSFYHILTEEDLLAFIHDNHEMGYLDFEQASLHRFPIGSVRSSTNKITTYDDYRLTSYLQEVYEQVPNYMRHENQNVSSQIEVATAYLLRKNWHLQSYEDTLKYMLGTEPDFLELAVKFFESFGYPVQRYQFTSLRNPHENHLFLAYEKDGQWYYFEPLFEPFYGIHAFPSKEDLEQAVCAKFMTFYTTCFDNQLHFLADDSIENKQLYERALSLQDRAIYDHRLSKKIHEEDPNYSLDFDENCYDKWDQSLNLLAQLPNCFEFYSLRRLSSPKNAISYDNYQSYLYYQTKITDLSKAYDLYEKEQYLLKASLSSLIVPGTYKEEEGVYSYHEVDIPTKYSVLEEDKREQHVLSLLHQSLFSLAYFVPGTSNTIFWLDSVGQFMQVKGVDCFQIRSGMTQYPMLNAKSPYAIQITKENGLQFRGMSDYMTLYHEKAIHDTLLNFQLQCPQVETIIDFPETYLRDNKLPRRQEKIEDYIQRSGLSLKIDPILVKNFSLQYPKGVWFGQVQRKIQNPFNIAHLIPYCEAQNKDRLTTLFEFSYKLIGKETPNLSSYLLYFAKTLGNQLALLFNQNYYYTIQKEMNDISLNGEICDAHFASYDAEIEKLSSLPHAERDIEEKKIQGSYYFQFFALTPSLKVLLNSASAIEKKNIDTPVQIVFLGKFLEGLTVEKQDLFFQFYQSLKEKDALDPFLKNLFSDESSLMKENKLFYRNLLSILEDFSKNPQEIVEKTNRILKEQVFINSISDLAVEDRFVAYIERRFKEGNLKMDTITIDDFCNDSRIGILLRKEPIMLETLSTLISYHLKNIRTFCEVGHDLIELSYTKDEIRKKELEMKIENYRKDAIPVSNPALSLSVHDSSSDEIHLDELLPSYRPAVTSSSGLTTPFYLIFILLGTSCIVLGIILSFLL